MAVARAYSVSLLGIDGAVIEIEAHVGGGLPAFTLVGLPDTALSEARDRVRAALINAGESFPDRRLTVALSPAMLPKSGAHYDLAIALVVIAANGKLPIESLHGLVLLGELGLVGQLRRVRGVLPLAMAAAAAGWSQLVVPEQNAAEAALVQDVSVLAVRSLRQLVAYLRGESGDEEPPARYVGGSAPPVVATVPGEHLDLSDVLGQAEARLAVEVAAAGGHHVFLTGPPGAGKTMLAERLPGLLPDLELAEALEVSAIHSVAGLLPEGEPLLRRPPFIDPHHTASVAAIVGGGSRIARPGSISLAHRGVLFLDEVPEFHPAVLEALRQPLESGEVMIARSGGNARYPAAFQLVLASNPCPCGRGGGMNAECTCLPAARARYRQRLSGPVRDRIDITRTVSPVSRAELAADRLHVETSTVVATRVAEARQRQRTRFREQPWSLNAAIPASLLRSRYAPDLGGVQLVDRTVSTGRLSARGADRVLRIAWSVADLAGADRPTADHCALALALRLDDSTADSDAKGRRAG
jgi:magnesium chelatase family protein